MASAYFVISFVGVLRSGEGLMMEATSLAHYIEEGRLANIPYVLKTLLGRFKGETNKGKCIVAFCGGNKEQNPC